MTPTRTPLNPLVRDPEFPALGAGAPCVARPSSARPSTGWQPRGRVPATELRRWTAAACCFFALSTTAARAANPDGALRVEVIAAHNLIVDSNVESPSTYAPRAAYLGAVFWNDGSTPLTDVYASIGDFNAGTPGVYPRRTHGTLTGFPPDGRFALTHEGGASGLADATRYLGTLNPGQSVAVYWLISYPNVDALGNAVWGPSVKPSDDLWLEYDVWVQGREAGAARTAQVRRKVTMRNEISAMANKIHPNTANKVPEAYLDLLGQYLPAWVTRDPGAEPGSPILFQGFWYDLGNVGAGFDNDGDLVPDRNAWMQPVGDPSLFDAGCFRLIHTEALVIVKLKTGGDLVITGEDQLYFENIPENNGAVGFVGYEFLTLGGPCQALFTPYQEVASGYDNEKFNGDYGVPLPPASTSAPKVVLGKDADVALVAPGGLIQYTVGFTNTGTVAVGDPLAGLPLVIGDSIPAGSTLKPGSAELSNTLPIGVASYLVRYSADHGLTWTFTEPPGAVSPVTDVQWWLSEPLPVDSRGKVGFTVVVNSPFTEPLPLIENTASLQYGGGAPFAFDNATTLVSGNNSLGDRVWRDDGSGGGVLGDGWQSGSEPGLETVTVSLYYDANADGALDAGDLYLQSAVTSSGGNYLFSNLRDGSYLAVVDLADPDLPVGFANTTPVVRPASLDPTGASDMSVSDLQADFGFAPALILDKRLVGASPVVEGQTVTYAIDLANLLPGDGSGVAQPCAYTVWSTGSNALDPENTGANSGKQWSNAANAYGANEPNGTPATSKHAGADERLGLFPAALTPTPAGSVTKVEVLVPLTGTPPFSSTDTLTVRVWRKVTGGTANNPNDTLVRGVTYNCASLADGTLAIDVTNDRVWTWADFDGSAFSIGLVANGGANAAGVVNVDAVGFRITGSTICAPAATPDTTLDPVPLVDTYDASRFEFLSADPPPDAVGAGYGRFATPR